MPVANDTAFVTIGRYDDQLVAGNSTAEHHIIAIMLIDHKIGMRCFRQSISFLLDNP